MKDSICTNINININKYFRAKLPVYLRNKMSENTNSDCLPQNDLKLCYRLKMVIRLYGSAFLLSVAKGLCWYLMYPAHQHELAI